MVFNPLEYAAVKKHPFFHVFYNTRLKPAIRFLRINDGLFQDGSATLPGQGNAELKELVSALLARSFKGYFAYVPYLEENGLEYYEEIIRRFRNILLSI
jgi:sugar phosphate isomerase/epimerase